MVSLTTNDGSEWSTNDEFLTELFIVEYEIKTIFISSMVRLLEGDGKVDWSTMNDSRV